MEVAYPPRRRMAGITLVETLTTGSVALVLTAVAVPAAQQFNASQETAAAVNALSGDLQLARHTAVSHGERVVLCPSTDASRCTGGFDWSSGWIVFSDDNVNRHRDDAERILHVRQPRLRDVRILTSQGRQKITYQSDGSSGGSNVTFRVCHRQLLDRNRAILVNNTGRPKLSRHDADGNPVRCD